MVNIDRHIEKVSIDVRMHFRVIWALILRELATRYGRDNIGFLWIVGEPVLFAGGVLTMWSMLRPQYEHGLRIAGFLVTGYLPLLLIRHSIMQGINCISVNQGLLYHRKITLLHLFVARGLLEVAGVTIAFFVLVYIMTSLDFMDPPKDLGDIYIGWFLLAWISFGLALILGCLVALVEFFEKVASLLTYVMVPLIGTFYMVAWVPYQFRPLVLKIPFVHCVEFIRAGFFGEFYPTYHSAPYAMAWAAIFTFVGLLMLRFVRSKIDVE